MDISTRELLGLGKDDHWGYAAFALVLVAFFVSSASVVALLTVLASGFLGLYLVRSTRRLLTSSELSRFVKRVGFVVNLVGALAFLWLALRHYERLAR
jgi:hypothetical protein